MSVFLTKIGNFKLGARKGKGVVAFEKILVTSASKNGNENFTPYQGFSEEGEDELFITLPFNSPELNFEVNYVSFVKVDNVEYIIKASEFGKDIIGYPINSEDFEKPAMNFGKLDKENIERFQMEKAGLLKAMIPTVSSFGEVFYLKTKSIHTINAIQNQLNISHALLGGLANYPFTLKAHRKDVSNGNRITFISIGLEMDRLRDYKENDEYLDDTLDYDLFEQAYIKSIEDINVIKCTKSEIIVMKENFTEIVSVNNEKDEILSLIKEAGVDEKHIELIMNNSNSSTIKTTLNYYNFLKKKTRKYSSVFTKKMKDGIKPFQMIMEISNGAKDVDNSSDLPQGKEDNAENPKVENEK